MTRRNWLRRSIRATFFLSFLLCGLVLITEILRLAVYKLAGSGRLDVEDVNLLNPAFLSNLTYFILSVLFVTQVRALWRLKEAQAYAEQPDALPEENPKYSSQKLKLKRRLFALFTFAAGLTVTLVAYCFIAKGLPANEQAYPDWQGAWCTAMLHIVIYGLLAGEVYSLWWLTPSGARQNDA